MTPRADIIAALQAADLRVDATNTDTIYTDGVCFVLPTPAEVTQTLTYSVVAAVNVGQDIDAYAELAVAAIIAASGLTPLGTEYDFGGTPVPGRDQPEADIATITVLTDRLYGEEA